MSNLTTKKSKQMLLFFSILGIFLSVILLSFNARKLTATLYLAGFFFLISLYVLSQYGLLYSKSVFLVTVLLVLFPMVFPPLYLPGPMLFWYIRSVLRDDARMRSSDLFHFLPMLIYFAASIPYTFSPFSEKVETAVQVVNNVGIMQTYAATFLSEIFPPMDMYLSRPVLLLAYTLWSIFLIVKYLTQKKLRRVFSGQNFMIKWVMLLTAFALLLATSHIILIIHTFKMHFSDLAFGVNVIRVISALGLIGLMISPFLFPSILYGLPRWPAGTGHKAQETGKTDPGETPNALNHLENDYLHSLGRRMDTYMKEHQPFLEPKFNINQLAVQIEVPVHHLAYYFREVKQQTFSEYRNRWRLAYAKELIREGKTNELTLEAIATLSGFPNRNSFRAAFQKEEGMSPGTFAGRHKEAG